MIKNTSKVWFSIGLISTLIWISSCKSIPKGAVPITNFEVKEYLGKWYEIARLDFKQEKNLNNVTAEYTLKDDGKIQVLNKGYNYVDNEWKESVGKATFRGNEKEGALKVSFFGPFYSGYNVIEIDKDYQYALVFGKNLDYMWILSRKTTIPDNIKQAYLKKAQSIGYNTDKLVWVEHNK